MNRIVAMLFLAACGPAPGAVALIEGPAEACVVTTGDGTSVGFIDEEGAGTVRVPPGEGARATRLIVEISSEDGEVDSQQITVDEDGLLPIPLASFPMGGVWVVVRA